MTCLPPPDDDRGPRDPGVVGRHRNAAEDRGDPPSAAGPCRELQADDAAALIHQTSRGYPQLHLTVQGLGFVGEVPEADVAAIVEATRPELAALPPRVAEAGPAYADSETVQVAIHPADEVAEVRAALRRGIAAVWGADNVPEDADSFRPHVTFAYSNSHNNRSEIAGALDSIGPLTTKATVGRLSLIRLHRDNQAYEWTEIAEVKIGR